MPATLPIELERVPLFWARELGMVWGPRGVASPVRGWPAERMSAVCTC